MWLKDLLPDYINDARIMAFEYSLEVDSGISTEIIQSLALKLLERILHESSEDVRFFDIN